MSGRRGSAPERTIALVGLMGVGKSSVGRRLAQRLGMPFADGDVEIEAAAGMTVSEIFSALGEAEFRAGEARVMKRLLEGPPLVLATGGGAILNLASIAGLTGLPRRNAYGAAKAGIVALTMSLSRGMAFRSVE